MAESVAETQDIYRPNVSSYDAHAMKEAPAPPKKPLSLDTSSIFSGESSHLSSRKGTLHVRFVHLH